MVHHTHWPRRIGTSLATAVAMSAVAGAFAAATAVADPAVHETTTSSCCDEPDPFDPNFSYTQTVRTLRTSPNSPEFNGTGRTPTSHTRSTSIHLYVLGVGDGSERGCNLDDRGSYDHQHDVELSGRQRVHGPQCRRYDVHGRSYRDYEMRLPYHPAFGLLPKANNFEFHEVSLR